MQPESENRNRLQLKLGWDSSQNKIKKTRSRQKPEQNK